MTKATDIPTLTKYTAASKKDPIIKVLQKKYYVFTFHITLASKLPVAISKYNDHKPIILSFLYGMNTESTVYTPFSFFIAILEQNGRRLGDVGRKT